MTADVEGICPECGCAEIKYDGRNWECTNPNCPSPPPKD